MFILARNLGYDIPNKGVTGELYKREDLASLDESELDGGASEFFYPAYRIVDWR
jgi:hypothetical protein